MLLGWYIIIEKFDEKKNEKVSFLCKYLVIIKNSLVIYTGNISNELLIVRGNILLLLLKNINVINRY